MSSKKQALNPLRIVSPLHKAKRQLSLYLGGRVRALGLEGADGHLLSYVGAYGPVRIGELRKVFGHQPSTLTSMLDRLERAGWLAREIDPEDRRGFLIRATREGARKGREARRVVEVFETELLARIQDRDLKGFQRVLDALADITQVKLRKE